MSRQIPVIPPESICLEDKKENEFGSLTSKEYLYQAKQRNGEPLPDPVSDDPPYIVLIITYLNFLILIILGHIHDFFGLNFQKRKYIEILEHDGYAPWYSAFESFYVRRLKSRIDDCFARPTTGVPGRFIKVIDRVAHNYNAYFTFPGSATNCLNLSSYNYLGFAQSEGQCTDAALAALDKYGVGSSGSRTSAGTTDLHIEAERVIADFVGKPASMLFSMGYGTNANLFTSLLDRKCLVISDELNHASIRFGVRLSGAAVKTFPHNNMKKLEALLREQISQGQPRTHRPWKKIMVCVEGLYSMEGTMANLPALIALREKYKFYLFVDEAHSIGAIGPSGRGVCDYFGVDPANVDILMGTLTKSFGAAGGYVAAEQNIIDRLKLDITTTHYGESVPTPVLAQIVTSLRTITGEINPGEGAERLQRIAFNSRYLRLALKRLGFIVFGINDSPVIPLLLFAPSKMPAFSRMMLQRKIAVVVVSYPATPLTEARVRFCVSAALTKEDIDYLLRHVDEIGDKLYLKFKPKSQRWDIEDVIAKTPIDCKDDKFF